jgi:hypothetical protein
MNLFVKKLKTYLHCRAYKKVKMNFLIKSLIPIVSLAVFTFLFSAFVILPNEQVYSQNSSVTPPQMQLESVKILNLTPFQTVDLKKELLVSGESSDTATKDCSVYVIVNGIQPYQKAVASGAGGSTDFSQWKFTLHEQYTHLNQGNNKVTAKLLCDTSPTRWYSVTVSAISSNASESVLPQGSTSETVLPEESTQQSNASESVLPQGSTSETVLPEESTQQSNASESVLPQGSTSETVLPEESTQQSNASNSISPEQLTQSSKLLVTISPLKNPVARGDRQSATITVTDSNKMAVSDAQINGKLVYPGDNFEKDFEGATDLDGEFIYSWTIGKKGDEGVLIMEVEAISQGFPPTSANSSFEIVKSSDSSKFENPFQSDFERQ